MKVAAAIAEILKREGVEFLIGYPVNHIIEAAAEADIRTIIVRQERTGIHMADGFSRINSGRRIGVFAMQLGPGAENSFGGVAQAFADSVPVLVLPGGFARDLTSIPPNFSAFLNYQHITKWAELAMSAAGLAATMRRAFMQVRNGRPRPVLVEVPRDLFDEEVPEPLDYTPTRTVRSAPDPKDVETAAGMLVRARRPVLYAGQGVHYARAWEPLRVLAELLGAPVTTTLQGKSAFPEDHRLSLGTAGRSMPKSVHVFMQEADVVFGVGCSFATTVFGITIPPGKTVIHSTLDPTDVNKDMAVDHALIGDAALTLEALVEAVRDRLDGPRHDQVEQTASEIERLQEKWLDEWRPKLKSDEIPLSPYRVIWDLMRTVDRDQTIITHDAGSPRDQMAPFWRTTTPLSYIGWGKSTQLGYGLGLAMGAKLAAPEKLCINVWGDAAIGFTGMDFETAVRERIPILSVLLNNFSMAIEIPVMKVATEKYRSTDISGNYTELARALGGYGERVTEPRGIVPAIQRGIEETRNGRPAMLEFITAKELEVSVFPT